MTAVAAGTSSTVTLGASSTVAVIASGSGRAQVAVTLSGKTIYSAGTAITQTVGPFPAQSVLTVEAEGPGVSYTTQAYTAPVTGGGVASTPTIGQPAAGTVFAVAASQVSNGMLIDVGPNQNVFHRNDGLFPVAIALSSAVSLNTYRSPSIALPQLFRCTTAGTTGSTEATWNQTIGGTTTQGTAIFTTEKGPYFVDSSGVRCFRSLASTQVGQQAAHDLTTTATNWDMLNGDSLIVNFRTKFDYGNSGQGAAQCFFSTSASGTGPGVRFLATGATFNDIRVQVRGNGGQNVLSGNMAQGFASAPWNGLEHNVTFMIDGVLKMAYLYVDGVGLTQAQMNSGGDLCPNGMNLVSINTSTAGTVPTIGGDPGLTTSVEVAMRTSYYGVFPGLSLPTDIQGIASWFARGGEGVLPALLAPR